MVRSAEFRHFRSAEGKVGIDLSPNVGIYSQSTALLFAGGREAEARLRLKCEICRYPLPPLVLSLSKDRPSLPAPR